MSSKMTPDKQAKATAAASKKAADVNEYLNKFVASRKAGKTDIYSPDWRSKAQVMIQKAPQVGTIKVTQFLNVVYKGAGWHDRASRAFVRSQGLTTKVTLEAVLGNPAFWDAAAADVERRSNRRSVEAFKASPGDFWA